MPPPSSPPTWKPGRAARAAASATAGGNRWGSSESGCAAAETVGRTYGCGRRMGPSVGSVSGKPETRSRLVHLRETETDRATRSARGEAPARASRGYRGAVCAAKEFPFRYCRSHHDDEGAGRRETTACERHAVFGDWPASRSDRPTRRAVPVLAASWKLASAARSGRSRPLRQRRAQISAAGRHLRRHDAPHG